MFKQKQIVENGIVKYINGNRATVEIQKPNQEECKSCGVCIGLENKLHLEVETIPELSVGQPVTLQIIKYHPYKSMMLLLILPIINLLIGSLIGQKFHFIFPNSQNIRMVSCGFIFFVLTIGIVSFYDKKIRNKEYAHRKIISINILNKLNLITN